MFCDVIGACGLARDVVLPARMKAILALLLVASPAFAAPVNADLPSADRISPWIRDRIGGNTARVDMRVCRAADGHVSSVILLRRSADPAFDRAVMNDVVTWRYEAASAPRCERTHGEYHMR